MNRDKSDFKAQKFTLKSFVIIAICLREYIWCLEKARDFDLIVLDLSDQAAMFPVVDNNVWLLCYEIQLKHFCISY